jgi:hypothetical protein
MASGAAFALTAPATVLRLSRSLLSMAGSWVSGLRTLTRPHGPVQASFCGEEIASAAHGGTRKKRSVNRNERHVTNDDQSRKLRNGSAMPNPRAVAALRQARCGKETG